MKSGSLPLSQGVPTNSSSFPTGLYGSDVPPYSTHVHTSTERRKLSQQYLAKSFYADYAAHLWNTTKKSPVSHFTAFIGDDFEPHGSIFPGLPHFVKKMPFKKGERAPVTMITTGENLMPADEPDLVKHFTSPTKKGDYMTPEEAQSILAMYEQLRKQGKKAL